jgi:hypothetical protein
VEDEQFHVLTQYGLASRQSAKKRLRRDSDPKIGKGTIEGAIIIFLTAFVRTYNAGLSFALLLWTHFSILHCMQPCPEALHGSLARKPCRS